MKIRDLIQALWDRRGIRYLFFGGLTVLVNLAAFALLSWLGLGLDAANALSITIALLFAYVTNTRFVFRSKRERFQERLWEFMRFVSARLFTMAVEFFGVRLLAPALGALPAKLLFQVIVIILNYVLSKWIIYRVK